MNGPQPGLYYIINRWRASEGEEREGRMLGLRDAGFFTSGDEACLGARWGEEAGNKVVWEIVPTGLADAEHCFFLINREGGQTEQTDGRAGRLLGFRRGKYVVLEPVSGDPIPWQLIPATHFNPTTGLPESWCPSKGRAGSRGSVDPSSSSAGGIPFYLVNRFHKNNGYMLDFDKDSLVLQPGWAMNTGSGSGGGGGAEIRYLGSWSLRRNSTQIQARPCLGTRAEEKRGSRCRSFPSVN